ncbi:hypothetical protein V500_06221 [Pseudogymnoascus sp. VKM F-4518 (FW-2643)]|nr:hypothetical protein V500_06221 [Pseudogymnoascus sp. VKM F-4518 (FW-2643)]
MVTGRSSAATKEADADAEADAAVVYEMDKQLIIRVMLAWPLSGGLAGWCEQLRIGLASSALAGVGGWGVVVVPTGGFCANQDREKGTLLV